MREAQREIPRVHGERAVSPGGHMRCEEAADARRAPRRIREVIPMSTPITNAFQPHVPSSKDAPVERSARPRTWIGKVTPVAMVACAALAVACGAQGGAGGESGPDGEPTAASTQAFTASACANEPITSADMGAVVRDPSFRCFFDNGVASPNALYSATSPEACRDRYVVEFDTRALATRDANLRLAAYADGTPSLFGPGVTREECGTKNAVVEAWGFRGGRWEQIGVGVTRGSWQSTPGFNVGCQPEPGGSVEFRAGDGYEKVRVFASVYRLDIVKGDARYFYFPVVAGLHGGRPC
jgi:hypothetical protein